MNNIKNGTIHLVNGEDKEFNWTTPGMVDFESPVSKFPLTAEQRKKNNEKWVEALDGRYCACEKIFVDGNWIIVAARQLKGEEKETISYLINGNWYEASSLYPENKVEDIKLILQEEKEKNSE